MNATVGFFRTNAADCLHLEASVEGTAILYAAARQRLPVVCAWGVAKLKSMRSVAAFRWPLAFNFWIVESIPSAWTENHIGH